MKLLKDRILKDGRVLEGNILKVDNFLNHQIDVELFNEMGKELKKRYEGTEITKILTVEVSGIAIAAIVAQYFNVPVVFAKKHAGRNMDKDSYEADVYSYTKDATYKIKVAKKFLNEKDSLLLVDDFLANGQALLGLIELANQSGAKVAGAGIAIEKAFQHGRELVEEKGVRVESLAIIEKMEDRQLIFK